MKNGYGIGLCGAIGVLALILSGFVPLGSVAIAILLGIAVGNLFKPGKLFGPGIAFSEKKILGFAVALMGVNLDFRVLSELGYRSLLFVISAMTVTVFTSILLGRLFKLNSRFALLLGIGNGICGSSAIAATKDIIGVDEEEVGLSVAIINFLGTMGIFLLPFIGLVVLKLSDVNAGMLVGNTLQAVGQVVAAGFSISDPAGQTATIVKMARVLMLTPVVFILIAAFSSRGGNSGAKNRLTGVPPFIIGFVLFSMVPTFSLISEEAVHVIGRISHYALIAAMSGIGLKIKFSTIVTDGKRALITAGLVFVVQILFSSSLILLFPGH